MIELERTITVDRPTTAVVGYLADFSNAEEWDSGTKACTRLDEGPVKVGSRWRNVSEFRGRETELQYTLIRSDPQRLTFSGENKTVTSTDDLRHNQTDEVSARSALTAHDGAAESLAWH